MKKSFGFFLAGLHVARRLADGKRRIDIPTTPAQRRAMPTTRSNSLPTRFVWKVIFKNLSTSN